MKNQVYKYSSFVVAMITAAWFFIGYFSMEAQFHLERINVTKSLPASETIPREEASIALQNLSRTHFSYARRQTLPAILMIIAFWNFSSASKKVAEQGAASDR